MLPRLIFGHVLEASLVCSALKSMSAALQPRSMQGLVRNQFVISMVPPPYYNPVPHPLYGPIKPCYLFTVPTPYHNPIKPTAILWFLLLLTIL